MANFVSKEDLFLFLKDKIFKNIFILCGENSFKKSGAEQYFLSFFNSEKEKYKIFFQKNYFPEINELIKIIQNIKKFQPDLILAIGGGSVLDYAKLQMFWLAVKI